MFQHTQKLHTQSVYTFVISKISRLGGVMVSVLATGPKVRGLTPGQEIVKGYKNPQHAFLQRGSKAQGPCRKILRHVKITSK
jgi:hypothetical protein